MSKPGSIEAWVVASRRQVVDFGYLAHSLATKVGSVHGQGQAAALDWIIGDRPAPMTQREERPTRALARAESWIALCVAAHATEPASGDWAQLGVEPLPWVAGDEDFAHGAWRTLAWLLGVRPDPPIDLPQRDENGRLLPGEQRYATRPNPDSPVWREAERRRLERNRAEARRWFSHVRARIDAQGRPASATG